MSTPSTTFDNDLEKTVHSVSLTSTPIPDTETLDIEHLPVQDDPRKWSPLRKVSYHQEKVFRIDPFVFRMLL